MQPKYSVQYQALYNMFINQLIGVKSYQQDFSLAIKKDYFINLCFEVSKIIEQESSLLRLRGPVKVFGNLNGQFGSLMKLFESFGSPTNSTQQDGDIEGNDYLFLGDYVDRGCHSIETISLLFALKMKFPENIFLLRGHHEDRRINKILGLGDECVEKFNEDIHDPNSAFQALNNVFDLLPLAAVIDDKILCVHGGIGTSLSRIENIESIQRPISINYEIQSYQQQILLDLLWSDPVYSQTETENQSNPDREVFTNGRIQRFGVNRIKRFLAENNLLLIIRSHESVPEGFEQMQHFLMTVFSASDYAAKNQNTAAILMIKKNSAIVPKVIQEPFRGKWMQFQLHGEENSNKFNMKKASLLNCSISESTQQVLINNIWFDKEEINIRKRDFTPPRIKVKKN